MAKLPADLEQMECDLMVIDEDAVSLLHSMVRCHVASIFESMLEAKLQMSTQGPVLCAEITTESYITTGHTL